MVAIASAYRVGSCCEHKAALGLLNGVNVGGEGGLESHVFCHGKELLNIGGEASIVAL